MPSFEISRHSNFSVITDRVEELSFKKSGSRPTLGLKCSIQSTVSQLHPPKGSRCDISRHSDM